MAAKPSRYITSQDVRHLKAAIRGLPPTSVPKGLGISSERFRNWMSGHGRISSKQRAQIEWLGKPENKQSMRELRRQAERKGLKEGRLENQFGVYLKTEFNPSAARYTGRASATDLDSMGWDDLMTIMEDFDYDVDPAWYH